MLYHRPTDSESLGGLGRILQILQVIVVHWVIRFGILEDGWDILRVLASAMNILL